MKKLNTFIKATILGGTVVILPIAILIFIFRWIFYFVTDLIQPLTNVVVMKSFLPEITADLLVIAIILFICFVIGMFVRTKLGQLIYRSIENSLLKEMDSPRIARACSIPIMSCSSFFTIAAIAGVPPYLSDTYAKKI